MVHEFRQHREDVAFQLLKLLIGESPLSVDIYGGFEGNQMLCSIKGPRPRTEAIERSTKQGWARPATPDGSALKIFVKSKRQNINM